MFHVDVYLSCPQLKDMLLFKMIFKDKTCTYVIISPGIIKSVLNVFVSLKKSSRNL